MAQHYTEALDRIHSARPATKPALTQLYAGLQEKPRELIPVGEGAYQSAEAVKQRTRDPSMDCEHGNVEGCYHKAGADIVDGHSYGNLPEPKKPQKSGAVSTSAAGVAVMAALLASLIHSMA